MQQDRLLDLSRDMRLIRAFEQALAREFEQGKVPGMVHTGLARQRHKIACAIIGDGTVGRGEFHESICPGEASHSRRLCETVMANEERTCVS